MYIYIYTGIYIPVRIYIYIYISGVALFLICMKIVYCSPFILQKKNDAGTSLKKCFDTWYPILCSRKRKCFCVCFYLFGMRSRFFFFFDMCICCCYIMIRIRWLYSKTPNLKQNLSLIWFIASRNGKMIVLWVKECILKTLFRARYLVPLFCAVISCALFRARYSVAVISCRYFLPLFRPLSLLCPRSYFYCVGKIQLRA